MKNLILQALKTKFEGVSEAILGRIAEKMAKTITKEEDVQTAVDGVTFSKVLESYGDSRATEASKTAMSTAIANYEKQYGLKDGKPVEAHTPAEENKGGDDEPAWAKALREQNEALVKRLNNMDLERTVSSRKKQLSEVIGKLPEALRKGYERMAIDSLSDEDFTKTLGDVTNEVEAIVKDTKQKGTVFGTPLFKGTQLKEDVLSDEQAKAIVDSLNI